MTALPRARQRRMFELRPGGFEHRHGVAELCLAGSGPGGSVAVNLACDAPVPVAIVP